MSYFIKVQRHNQCNAMIRVVLGVIRITSEWKHMAATKYNAIWGVVYPEKSFKIMDPLSSNPPPNERT